MSSEDMKYKNSRRRFSDDLAVAKQVKIAKSTGAVNKKYVDQPGRLVKHHAMDCGNPRCGICGNKRRISGDLTYQERKMFQDTDDEN